MLTNTITRRRRNISRKAWLKSLGFFRSRLNQLKDSAYQREGPEGWGQNSGGVITFSDVMGGRKPTEGMKNRGEVGPTASSN